MTGAAAAWVLGPAAVLVGTAAISYCVWAAVYMWFEVDPPSVAAGAFWTVVALGIPAAAETARRLARRRGQDRAATVALVGATTIMTSGCVPALIVVAYAVGAFL